MICFAKITILFHKSSFLRFHFLCFSKLFLCFKRFQRDWRGITTRLERYYNAIGEVLQCDWRSITTQLEKYYNAIVIFWNKVRAFFVVIKKCFTFVGWNFIDIKKRFCLYLIVWNLDNFTQVNWIVKQRTLTSISWAFLIPINR